MDTIGKKLALKEKMAYGCGDAASNCNLFLCTSGCEEVWKRKDYDVWLDYYLCQLCDIVTIYRKYNGTDYYSCYEGNRILLLACSVFCDGK